MSANNKLRIVRTNPLIAKAVPRELVVNKQVRA